MSKSECKHALEIPQYRKGTERYHVPIRNLQENLDLLQGGGTIA